MEKRPASNVKQEHGGLQPSNLKKGLQPSPKANVGRPPTNGTSVQKPKK